jgi:hypothetical protein
LDALVDSVQEALSKGDNVTLVGFGTFSVMSRAARKGVIPKPDARSSSLRAKHRFERERPAGGGQIRQLSHPRFEAGRVLFRDALPGIAVNGIDELAA